MKTKGFALLLALAATACQHTPPAAADAVVAAGPTPQPAALATAATDSLSPTTRAMLRQYNLAPLWANRAEGKAAQSAMEGFFGTSPYRISFYFSSVERDPAQPNLFHVTGLDRYKKVITPFRGTITVRQIHPFTYAPYLDDPDSLINAFTANGQFILREDPTTKGAGCYSGKALLDFYLNQHKQPVQATANLTTSAKNPTLGSGLLFRGTQVSNATGRRQPVAFAGEYWAAIPNALQFLRPGGRGDEVSPNLAHFGWNSYWENDEWWAKSPKPQLSL
ncbi:hypothetical protein MON38_17300 [Hymenobacter sp. DH14]|uniref:Uncharacterized protein n=1 Tax=Hymenobacter cyanobacteriorum TaxID=2926463 RepID=A0A9X1VJ83_9BACT|nr:hypothetical protein [Hymenobacter cyanobacteriorum]MCI1189183.1 hypothetical protein [Hymenobacter cyanobacteriorum]